MSLTLKEKQLFFPKKAEKSVHSFFLIHFKRVCQTLTSNIFERIKKKAVKSCSSQNPLKSFMTIIVVLCPFINLDYSSDKILHNRS